MVVLTDFAAYFVTFLHGVLLMPQMAYAAVIAVFFGLVTASKPGLIVVPVIAAIVYIAALTLGPVVLNHAALVVPSIDAALAKKLAAAYLLFLLADVVVYAIKKAVLAVID